jgi:hypothetical protein
MTFFEVRKNLLKYDALMRREAMSAWRPEKSEFHGDRVNKVPALPLPPDSHLVTSLSVA